jgi:hypothetical protein
MTPQYLKDTSNMVIAISFQSHVEEKDRYTLCVICKQLLFGDVLYPHLSQFRQIKISTVA